MGQREPLIEVFRRNEREHWELIEARLGIRIELASLDISLEVDAIYSNPLR